jgi:hypothetical protein
MEKHRFVNYVQSSREYYMFITIDVISHPVDFIDLSFTSKNEYSILCDHIYGSFSKTEQLFTLTNFQM